jgi:hypothetical protein
MASGISRSRWELTADIVNGETIFGALDVYIIFGMLFSAIYASIGAFSPSPFFGTDASINSGSYQFFSFVTFTTVGYGNLVPATQLGQSLAVIEALLGQVYLVTLVARLVGGFQRGAGHRAAERLAAERAARAEVEGVMLGLTQTPIAQGSSLPRSGNWLSHGRRPLCFDDEQNSEKSAKPSSVVVTRLATRCARSCCPLAMIFGLKTRQASGCSRWMATRWRGESWHRSSRDDTTPQSNKVVLDAGLGRYPPTLHGLDQSLIVVLVLIGVRRGELGKRLVEGTVPAKIRANRDAVT